METKLKKYHPLTDHPCWNFNGTHFDLRKIDDKQAAMLVKGGFKLLEKIPPSTG